jgi:hypothetical protein
MQHRSLLDAIVLVVVSIVLWLAPRAHAGARPIEGEEEEEEEHVVSGEPPAPADPVEEKDPVDGEAPRPGEALRIEAPPRQGAQRLLWVPRVILFVPRAIVWGVFTPPRVSLVAMERHRVVARVVDVFYNDARTFGVLPILRVERFLGTFVGARVVYLDLFGAGGALAVRAGVGDRFRQDHRLSIDTGRLLGWRTVVRGWAQYRLRPRETFAGIGNVDTVFIDDSRSLPSRLDAMLLDDIGVISRFREDRAELGIMVEHRLRDTLFVRLGQEVMRKTFDDAIAMQEPYITTVYDPATLTGFETGFLQSYVEASFVYTNLRTVSRFVPSATPSTGWRVRGYHGLAHVLVPGGRYQRTGLDIARFINLFHGDRVLRLRLVFDLVQGSYQQVPFSELPRLGGGEFLRGYRQDVFRDRLAALGSAEYYFPLGTHIAAYAFADVGRVYGGLHELSVRGLRLGFGGGLQLHEGPMFIARMQLASSVGGELMFQLRFEPTFSVAEYL